MNTDLALRILKGSSSDFAHPLSLSLSYCILFRILYTDLFEKKKKKEESEKKKYSHKKIWNIFSFYTVHLCFQLQMSWKLCFSQANAHAHMHTSQSHIDCQAREWSGKWCTRANLASKFEHKWAHTDEINHKITFGSLSFSIYLCLKKNTEIKHMIDIVRLSFFFFCEIKHKKMLIIFIFICFFFRNFKANTNKTHICTKFTLSCRSRINE